MSIVPYCLSHDLKVASVLLSPQHMYLYMRKYCLLSPNINYDLKPFNCCSLCTHQSHCTIISDLTAAPGTPQHTDEQFLSRLFLFVALVIMFWLLIA